jgi:hypothetical protein
MSFDLKQKTVVVFSHPNHEIAILALLKKVRPFIIFLTDGGGKAREDETRKGLRSIGLLDNAIFLSHPEQAFYDGLLHVNSDYFHHIAHQVRNLLKNTKPEQILCDAVEFYNPVHDLTLAIVGSADDAPWAGTYEVPLLYQKPQGKESYGVQTVPDGQPRQEFALSAEETELKTSALRETYSILRETLGPLLLSSPAALTTETIFPASSPLRWPDPGRLLRYERRAAALKAEGKVESEITHSFHFLPVVAQLLEASHR